MILPNLLNQEMKLCCVDRQVEGNLIVEDQILSAPIVLQNVTFNGDVKFISCVFKQTAVFFDNQFKGDIDFSKSHFEKDIVFSGSTFKKKAIFQGSTITGTARFIDITFKSGADFTNSTFESATFFILSCFEQPVSFYGATFEKDANFTNATFTDISFSDSTIKRNLTFYGAKVKGRILFISTLQGGAKFLGDILDFRRTELNEIILSGGDPTPESEPGEFTGAILRVDNALDFRRATIRKAVFNDIQLDNTLNLLDVKFEGPMYVSSGSDFKEVKFDRWPSGKILPFRKGELKESMYIFIRLFNEKKDAVNENLAYFDYLAIGRKIKISEACSRFFGNWRSKISLLWEIPSYILLSLFWVISEFGTNLLRVFGVGIVFILLFMLSYIFYGKHNCFTKIQRPLEIKTRLSDTPILSFGEISLETTWVGDKWFKPVRLYFLFSFYTFVKLGVGDIRLRPEATPFLKMMVWTEWGLGYLWYLLLIYTLSRTAPILKGLLGGI